MARVAAKRGVDWWYLRPLVARRPLVTYTELERLTVLELVRLHRVMDALDDFEVIQNEEARNAR